MKSRGQATHALSAAAIGLALALAHAPCALAQDSVKAAQDAQGAMPDAQKADAGVAAANALRHTKMLRTTVTGSNIIRVRTEESLPIQELDRTYIDRTGVSNTTELLRTVPQIQISR